MQVNVSDAKNNLPKLIKAVEDGESVTICRRGAPVVDLVPTTRAMPESRRLGSLTGQARVIDPDWWKPMSAKEVKAFIEGRY